ncbi:MAG: M28 family peptidase [Anaerolineae bacterium]|jgi:hypothetical protein
MADRPLIKVMVIVLLLLVSCAPTAPTPRIATVPPGLETPTPSQSPAPAEPTTSVVPPSTTPGDPFDLISQESLFDTLETLTSIQPYSGWRNSTSEGEREALDTIEQRLHRMAFLAELGMELERQSFSVFLGTELWETRLDLTINGQTVEVPADGLRGDRDLIARAIRFDSDGTLNDEARDPVTVEGPVVLLESAEDVNALRRDEVAGKIVFLNYAAVDRITRGHQQAVRTAADLLAKEPAGLVLVTWFSNAPRESHGAFVGDLSAFTYLETGPSPPVLYMRMEDLAPTGIVRQTDLERIEAARITWDADVRSPAPSGNLVARIPGADSSRTVILGAHIDSPNGPGAMDDGSGSAILLEVARVLDLARVQPPTDLVLVWFGSEELGLYGSYHFASTHQELLDRSLAMLQIDCLTRPLDGIEGYLNLVTWSYGRLGDDRLTWPDFLVEAAEPHGVWAYATNYYGIESDNTALAGFDVPNANLIYMNYSEMEALGSLHYAGHIHDPYDTVELAREVAGPLEEMARMALLAALETGSAGADLRVARDPDRRAVFVGSHTEAIHMSPTTFTDIGMALAWEGFDVDLIPYGQQVTAADLEDADLVVALPVIDYPSPEGDPLLYDAAWDEAEIAALEAYVDDGGVLVLTNSAHRLKYANWVQDPNEDWEDVNALASRFGVTYEGGELPRDLALSSVVHPLLEGVDSLELIQQNSVSFHLEEGQVLAHANGVPALALVDYGAGGQVVVLADVGMLNSGGGEPTNLPFWLNLARHARSRR